MRKPVAETEERPLGRGLRPRRPRQDPFRSDLLTPFPRLFSGLRSVSTDGIPLSARRYSNRQRRVWKALLKERMPTGRFSMA